MKETNRFYSELMRKYTGTNPNEGVIKVNGSIFEKSNFFSKMDDENTNPLTRVDATPAEIRRYLDNPDKE